MSVQYLFLVIFALQTFKIMSLRIKEVLKPVGGIKKPPEN